jgi:hypothetical protein
MGARRTGRAPRRAGGRGTQAGMAFQAEVGTWFAAHMLARLPVGARFGLANSALPVSLRLETGEGLDDILVIQDDESRIDVQSKTSADLSQSPTSPLGKTIHQLAGMMVEARSAGVAVDPARVRAVLAVSEGASRTLENLERGCRAFDMGGTWAAVKEQRSEEEADALDRFEAHARSAWAELSDTPPSDRDLVAMARLFRIVRFSMNEGENNWREASRMLGGRLYGADTAGDAPLRELKTIIEELIENGGSADREGLLRSLRTRGHSDTGAPGYDADLARLRTTTEIELDRLAGHTLLPIGGGIPLPRQSYGPLAAAISAGSLLVIGEPGAGKTGALVTLAQARRAAGDTVFFLSVDNYSGVSIAAQLQAELQLEHPLPQVLAAAPGSARKLLIIDALDAARGGPAEGVFAQLIETVAALDAFWTVAASIRTFDLKNGRRFRAAFSGSAPDTAFAEPTLRNVRHFQVPRLNDEDLVRAGADAPELGSLLAAAPEKLRELLHNIFNLSLAAQLLTDGTSPDSIRTVSTQSDLIDAYEEQRLIGTTLQRTAGATVAAMVSRRRLVVGKTDVETEHLDEIIRTGVLTEAGDDVRFSHHVLFDHVASRFFLERHDGVRLMRQLGGDSSIALMLAPALRFSIERSWNQDAPDKRTVWRLVADIYANTAVDPVLANVALRTAIEHVCSPSDVVGLTALIGARAGDAAITIMLSRLARFVGIAVDAAGGIASEEAVAWANVAQAAIAPGLRDLSDCTRFLLYTLFDKADLSYASLLPVFGRGARALLTFAWAANPPMQQTTTNAIRFVGKSIASDPAASRALLDRSLRDPHFSAHADAEARWLAEQILPIAGSDSDFAIEIYRVLYSRDITDESVSYFGGQASRIMPLSSNRRQDYRSSRHELARSAGRFLELSARAGTRAVIEVTLKDIDRDTPLGDRRKRVSVLGQPSFELLGGGYGFQAWDETDRNRGNSEENALEQYVNFLRTCTPAAFAESVGGAASGYTSPAVWARLFGVGAERAGDVADVLWPYASDVGFLAQVDTLRNAVRFLAAAYPSRTTEERAAFETEALRPDLFTEERRHEWWRHVLSRFLFSVDQAAIATDAMRALRLELIAAGELAANTPLTSTTVTSGERRGMMRSMLRREGVDVQEPTNARMIAQSDHLHELVGRTPTTSDAGTLAALWEATEATLAMYDREAAGLHENLEQPVWGHISNAVERIAKSDAYVPGTAGMPSIEALLMRLRRLWASRFPEPQESQGVPRVFGNWEVRVYAAESYVWLAHRFGEEHAEIVDMIEAVLADPVPLVRLQAAESLQVISRSAPERMWLLGERIVRDEPIVEILASYIGNALERFTWENAERCETLTAIALERRSTLERDEGSGRDSLSEVLGSLTARLWVWQERPRALEWLTEWVGDPVANRDLLYAFLLPLREAFVARYVSGEAHSPPRGDRAQQAAMLILEACCAVAAESHHLVVVDRAEGEARDAAVERYRAAEEIIHHLMNQIYFGSGAHREDGTLVDELLTAEQKQRFLSDYRPMLTLLATSHEPGTHHELVELYEYLIPGDPACIFNALHSLLLGAGAREGYHHESLATTEIVRIVTRYIADYRSLFEDEDRRARLVEILRLFSEAGWPAALKLFYDLPELLR